MVLRQKEQMWILRHLQSALETAKEVAALVHRWPEPVEVAVIEDGVERHAFDHSALGGRLAEAAIRLSNRRPERLVVDVEHPAAVDSPVVIGVANRRSMSPLMKSVVF